MKVTLTLSKSLKSWLQKCMAKGEWSSPAITIETKEGPFKLFDGTGHLADIYDELVLGELHELASTTEGNNGELPLNSSSPLGETDYYQALSNLITVYIDIIENAQTSNSDLSPNTARVVLKDLQPNRELTSKDCRSLQLGSYNTLIGL